MKVFGFFLWQRAGLERGRARRKIEKRRKLL